MRVVFAAGFTVGDRERLNPIRGDDAFGVGIAGELVQPVLEPETVGDDEVRFCCRFEVRRGGVVAVDFGAGLGEGVDVDVLAGDVPGDVGQDRERCQDVFFAVVIVGESAAAARGEPDDERSRDGGEHFCVSTWVFGGGEPRARIMRRGGRAE